MKTTNLKLLSSVGAIAFAALTSHSSDRVALVVGIDSYKHATPLRNAVSDAQLVTKVLKETGFDVVSLENPGVDSFYEGLDQLKRRSGLARVGIVYFAGHGVEVEGENYLLPVDAELERSIQLRSQAISLETILEDLSEARLEAKVVILDCCRDNPLKRSWMNTRSVGRGLAPILDVNMPEASLVVYSAGPGQVALDGNDGNSPFTKALANRLRQPGQNLLQAFLKTSDDVVDLTGGRQEPWVKMDAAGRAMRQLVLVPEKGRTQPTGASPATVAKAPQPAPGVPAPGVTSASTVGNGTPPAPLKKEDAGQVMKETPAPVAAAGEPAPTIGNTPEQPKDKPVVESKPPVLPSRGYYTNSEIFEGGPYSGYNSYSQKKILKSAQGKLSGAGTPDGVMGRKTQSALVSYQQANNIPVTGTLDSATLAAMGLTGLPEETYTAPVKKSYSKPKTYTSSSPSRSTGGSSQSSNHSSGSSGNQNSGTTKRTPSLPKPGFPPAPGFPPMMKPPSPMKSSGGSNSGGGGSFYKPPTGKTGMSHARKKFLRPG